MLEAPLFAVGTVLRLDRDAWSTVNRLRQATDEYVPPPPTKHDLKGGIYRSDLVHRNGGASKHMDASIERVT